MKVVDFNISHLYQMKMQDGGIQPLHRNASEIIPANINIYRANYERPGLSYTGVKNGMIVACGGIIPVWDGMGECWTYISTYAKENKRLMLSVTRHVKKHLDKYLDEDKLFHRVQMFTVIGSEDSERWAKFFGFHNEGIMEMFDPYRNDWTRWARLQRGIDE